MAYLKVRNHENLVRDSHSKAVLNTDRAALDDYYKQLKVELKQKAEQEETKRRIASLEENMSEIKSLLQELVSMRKV
jgi:mevalonate kinase